MTLRETYITATKQLIDSGADVSAVASGLRSVLKERGHEQLQRSVFEGLLRHFAAGNATQSTVALASSTQALKFADEIKALVGTEETATTTIDETLVGGYIVEANGVRHDASYKNALLKLYRRITT